MLGQAQTARILDQCSEDARAIVEILSAYVFWKYLKGASTTRVLYKMRMLCIYLRTTGRTRILEHRRSFMLVGIEVARGGGTIGKTPLRTRIGIDVWNQLRRQARAKIVITDSEEGGPGPVLAFITNEQRYVSAVHRGFLGMERWFAIDERVPSYTSDRATLPLYRSQEERDEISAQLVSVMNELQL